MGLQERIAQVEQRIQAACERSGRQASDVQMVAVTKYVSTEKTGQVLDAGLIHLGENRWQNAKDKWEALHERGVWHFIGHLQTNKVKDVIGKFEYIHSLDRLSLAKELEKKAAELELIVKVFVQINVSGEESKYGLAPEAVEDFFQALQQMPHLKVVGLMTMAPEVDEPEQTRPVFRGLRELRDQLNTLGLTAEPIKHLSMGMSGDFEIAVEEGATFVRLGSILVGKEED
ncbi:YggS family pyridoxal phosphate-dependent enzyme [Paenibacillus hunanensis]|uniref:Pyridoxal phosphate homeostasis protein n=1 Tax=Paenibacillus hunanensis TaxID=539262 RepID=A0ABU1J2J0_9BACL|nr:YggS family pyridoxal phosphate-dependent enzyme [Paenibacillus hunanensis]MDR6245730.1 pyridoxal phosphate enzyme (YggS family) [Paenibacillus hunanensis]GGJ19822.1 YggS family pyridoxal phosphate enzyme [Paenibacillus hunanensis]